MIRYENQSLFPILLDCCPYVLKYTSSVIVQQHGICSTGVHETNLLIGKFILDEFVQIPAKKRHTSDLNFVKFELKVLNYAIIRNINSQHEDLNNWCSEPLLWWKQGRIIICINLYGVRWTEKIIWHMDCDWTAI